MPTFWRDESLRARQVKVENFGGSPLFGMSNGPKVAATKSARKARAPPLTCAVACLIDLPQVTAGLKMRKFREKARAFLKEHESHLALQR